MEFFIIFIQEFFHQDWPVIFVDHVFVCVCVRLTLDVSSWLGHMCFFLIIQWVCTLDDWWLRGLHDSIEGPPNLPTPGFFFNKPEIP